MDSPRSEAAPPPAAELARWFADEVQPHDARLKAYLRGSFPAIRDVDDVAQESYLRIWRARAATPIDSARSLLFTVARRLALDHLRGLRRSPWAERCESEVSRVPGEQAPPNDLAVEAEHARLLASALAELPARARDVVVLCKIDGLSHAEAAARLGISPKTVDEHMVRGLKRLGEILRRRARSQPV